MKQIAPGTISRNGLARLLGIGVQQLEDIAANVPAMYRQENREIGSKMRILSIPMPTLKALQRDIYDAILSRIPTHEAVFCRPGRGILDAVRRHQGHPYLLHLDIRNFFPSTSHQRVRGVLKAAGFCADVASLLTRLTTYRKQLPQGAPTSVAMGNIVLERLDNSLWNLCRGFGLTYTRYVDDIAISGGRRVNDVEERARRIFERHGWELSAKGGLTQIRKDKPKLLGIILGTSLSVDPTYLADVSIALNDYIDSNIKPSKAEMMRLRGRISWTASVDPDSGRELESLLSKLDERTQASEMV